MALETVNDGNFKEKINERRSVLIVVTAAWAPQSKIMLNLVEEMAQKYASDIAAYTVDAEESPATSQAIGLYGVPSTLMFKNGVEFWKIEGLPTRSSLERKVVETLNQ